MVAGRVVAAVVVGRAGRVRVEAGVAQGEERAAAERAELARAVEAARAVEGWAGALLGRAAGLVDAWDCRREATWDTRSAGDDIETGAHQTACKLL